MLNAEQKIIQDLRNELTRINSVVADMHDHIRGLDALGTDEIRELLRDVTPRLGVDPAPGTQSRRSH